MAITTRHTLSAGTLTGDEVKNSAGESLGTIKDIMLDVDSGRIAYAVLSYGGFLGLGDKLFAVPWSSLQLNAADHSFLLDVDEEVLRTAEGFDKNNWPDMTDQSWGERTYRHYGADPYW